MAPSRRGFELTEAPAPTQQGAPSGPAAGGDGGTVKVAKPFKVKVKAGPKKVSRGTRRQVKLTEGEFNLFKNLVAPQEPHASRHVGVSTPFLGLFPPVSLSL